MSIQDIPVSHNKKKKLAKCIKSDTVLIEDEGELILNVSEYLAFKAATLKTPIEDVLGEGILDESAEYIVFS